MLGCVVAVGSGYNELIVPANLLPVATAKNQIPIIKEVKRAGDNLFTIDKPIGLKHNSPMVCKKYTPVRTKMLAPLVGITLEPKAISQKPIAKKPSPSDCL